MPWLKQLIRAALEGDKRARYKLLGVAAALALVAAFFLSGSGSTSTNNKLVSLSQPTNSGANKLPATGIWVHIVGAIQNPGVYSMPSGARVFELVAAAGGYTKNADQSSVNLARNLTDGEQITVLAKGASLDSPAKSSTISLNSASEATLETLPGVGPKLAARIIDWRDANSGFKKIEDLRHVGGIGDKLFAAIKDMVSL